MNGPDVRKCSRHADTPAVARCVVCGDALCAACARTADGKYYCERDLAARASSAAKDERPSGRLRPLILAAVAALVAAIWLLLYLMKPAAKEAAAFYQVGMTQQRLTEVADALDAFKKDMGRYPTAQEGLGALVKEPAEAGRWLGPYIPSTAVKEGRVVDGAGKPVGYGVDGEKHVVVGAGRDGKLGTADDVKVVLEERRARGAPPELPAWLKTRKGGN